MKKEDRELVKKFWKWHKTRVDRSNTMFDLDYYEVVEDVLRLAEKYAKDNWIWRKKFEHENLLLLLRIREFQEENQKIQEEQYGLIKLLQKLLEEKKNTNEKLNS